jgi:hypothetical protein
MRVSIVLAIVFGVAADVLVDTGEHDTIALLFGVMTVMAVISVFACAARGIH